MKAIRELDNEDIESLKLISMSKFAKLYNTHNKDIPVGKAHKEFLLKIKDFKQKDIDWISEIYTALSKVDAVEDKSSEGEIGISNENNFNIFTYTQQEQSLNLSKIKNLPEDNENIHENYKDNNTINNNPVNINIIYEYEEIHLKEINKKTPNDYSNEINMLDMIYLNPNLL